ncbi:MAG: isocitrate/isopropylmalate dehydrogenase family protein [Candidatus Bipolaricaulota bacterium]|nr:isocitrate/isopropylmalate dehydrogenase family protein [Candidatus Bipolaricaulota bacterium]MCS7273915.1 isocitrate/isopropylmalate dehydrogenase family protein [Candidatus Bipolaricaulota bacterium]MDW8110798.1 isocitrate/isopropylmalate dehydrogenase family protein [Candidatus Bipolaricaulota bacterium]MDW8328721.1 isocitrate/isopropylmalate dehydrogenase family protein [Candidatus Bipolaricaulota bacterium]
MPKQSYSIVVLPGDGVGPEVIAQALKVLRTVGEQTQMRFEIEEIPCGGWYYAQHEKEWPDGSFEKCQRADAILLGAVGHEIDGKPVFTKPGKPYPTPQLAGYAQVIGNRQRLNLYANVRPVKLYPGVKIRISGEFQQIWKPENVDYVVVRENTEDAYTGETLDLPNGKMTPIRITKTATEKVVRFAFRLARQRKRLGKVTCVDKSNIIGAHKYFRDLFTEIGRSEFPEIQLDYAYFDAFCQWQIRNPEWYDVVVAPNLVGDVISDNAATTQGGLGMAAGGNIGDEHAMFEPIHGSAPKHAGKDKVNPIAAILTTKMMLEWLANKYQDERLERSARAIEQAVIAVLRAGQPLTYDLVGEERAARCSEVGDAITEQLKLFLKAS